MPYETSGGDQHELASRLGHTHAIVRALAEEAHFYVPAEHVRDIAWLQPKIRHRSELARADEHRLTGVIGVDGSLMVVPVRDGLPSVRYGYAQAAAIWLDLELMQAQRKERFVDPVALHEAVKSNLISMDMPVAGAYLREGMSIEDSWRESVDRLFREKKIEVNRLDQSLLELLMLLHGRPGAPAHTVPVDCPRQSCRWKDVAVPEAGRPCPRCGSALYPTDTLRIYEEVVEDGENSTALGRLMQVVELLVLVGLSTLLWRLSRTELFTSTLFVIDGPMAVYGPPAKLRGRALGYFQSMEPGPFVCGVEKTGTAVDYARSLVRHEVLKPGDLLLVDDEVIAKMTNAGNPLAYGSETYWGRKFFYRSLDGRVVVITVLPGSGAPYDDHGGQADPAAYPSLPAILDVVDRTGSSMYRDGLIPVALAHSKAAYPIGVGTDVLRLVAKQKLGLRDAPDDGPAGR
ncbi:DNA double-strand break repair nuclease NurA [Nonomuraea typhae]|uniref:DNA double-strand break repair nuclease NurA n=1 Tax=Nonomuraea typhae TaxID=2603600 RepID=UPI0012F97F49|nr:DNA double-strand break repair nuclease NurA [Nonomuraea typhae]